MKVCTTCGVEKELEGFHVDAKGKHGVSARCKKCAKAHVRAYNESNKELIRFKKMERTALLRDIREVKRALGMLPEIDDRDRLRSVWNQIGQRCNNPNSEKYPICGARGISRGFANWKTFYSWSMANGYRKGLEIDRIDNDGDYTPGNCRWVERSVNVRNRSVTVKLYAFGEEKSVAEWSEDPRCVVSYQTLLQRVRKTTWSPEEMVTVGAQPNQNGSRNGTKGGDADDYRI